MPKKSRSSIDYIREIEGIYPTMDDLEQAVVDLVNNNLDLMPIGYTYRDLLEWGQQKKWIFKENHKYRIKVK